MTTTYGSVCTSGLRQPYSSSFSGGGEALRVSSVGNCESQEERYIGSVQDRWDKFVCPTRTCLVRCSCRGQWRTCSGAWPRHGDEVQAHAVVSSGQGPLLVIVLSQGSSGSYM